MALGPSILPPGGASRERFGTGLSGSSANVTRSLRFAMFSQALSAPYSTSGHALPDAKCKDEFGRSRDLNGRFGLRHKRALLYHVRGAAGKRCPRHWSKIRRLMQTCKKGAHFAQHVCLVRQKDIMICMWHSDHMRGRHAVSNAFACASVLSRVNGLIRRSRSGTVCSKRPQIVGDRINRQDRYPDVSVLLLAREDR